MRTEPSCAQVGATCSEGPETRTRELENCGDEDGNKEPKRQKVTYADPPEIKWHSPLILMDRPLGAISSLVIRCQGAVLYRCFVDYRSYRDAHVITNIYL